MGVAMLRMKDIISTVVLNPMNVVSNHRICGGSGLLVGNLNEALNKLTIAINNRRGLTLIETKELFIFLRNR